MSAKILWNSNGWLLWLTVPNGIIFCPLFGRKTENGKFMRAGAVRIREADAVGAGAVPLPALGINKSASRRIFRAKSAAAVFFSSPTSLSSDLRRFYF
jgi:hypothetical protein